MTKKFLVITVFILIIAMATMGCGKKPVEESTPTITNEDEINGLPIRETLVYYQDDVGYLVPVMRKIPWEEGIAKATIKLMMDTEEQQEDLIAMGLRALLPKDAEVLGMSISEDGIARIDFNSALLECDNAIEEANMIQGLVMTLAEFSTIEEVQFLFDGQIKETLKFGTKVKNPIAPQDVNVEMSASGEVDGAKVVVFFQSTSPSQYDYLVPVTRVIGSTQATLEAAIKEMLNGPKELSNINIDIPQGTKLLGIQMEDGVTYINFSKEFKALANSPESEALVFKAIMMTARQFPEVEQVEILVEGKEYEGTPTDSATVFANQF